MNPISTYLFYLILAILIVDFILERVLEYLNTTRWSDTLPDELMGQNALQRQTLILPVWV